ncbi:MAG: phosphatase PAP2 family protein [Gemmatimonas sp.]
MGTGETQAAKRAQGEIWLIPLGALCLMLMLAWVIKDPIRALKSSDVHVWDTQLLLWFRTNATPPLDQAAQAVSFLASAPMLIAYAFGGVSILARRKRWLLLFAWDAAFVGLLILSRTLKPIFHRARPEGAEQFLTSVNTSFPSNHALGAIVSLVMIAFVLSRLFIREREQRAAMWVGTILLIALIGTTRLYLGVHYLSDVVAGFAFGGAWLAVCLFALRRAEETTARLAMASAFFSSKRSD